MYRRCRNGSLMVTNKVGMTKYSIAVKTLACVRGVLIPGLAHSFLHKKKGIMN